MKIFELRGFLKERGIRDYSTLKKAELEAKVREIKEKEEVAMYEENIRDTVICEACLREQRVQRKINDQTHDQRLLESTLRILVCDYCKHAELTQDGDDIFCVICGALQDPKAEVIGRYRN